MGSIAEPGVAMADSAEPLTHRYSAFVSYSHADAAAVRKLHRRLETYRLPSRLVAQRALGSRRLKAVFRDDDEMGAAHDLTEAIRDALAQADHLIVICSPAAAKSAWVAREIELFRELHGDRRILAALVDGDPETSFPAALLSGAHHSTIEPLAADFRPGVGDRRLAFLKLVAPMAGVRLDDLVHRDAQRRVRQVVASTGGAILAIGLLATLLTAALIARSDAVVQTRRANGLGDFMQSELRKGLEADGRLDLLRRMNRATLKPFEGADVDKMTPEQQEQHAADLQQTGKDEEKAGDLKGARRNVDQAHRITERLLALNPNESERLYAHAQSEYWVGFINWREGDSEGALHHFRAYAALANRLNQVDGRHFKSAIERVYAEQNLGALALRQAGDPLLAESHFNTTLIYAREIPRSIVSPADQDELLSEEQKTLAWLADAQRLQGHLKQAMGTREAQRNMLERMIVKAPRDHGLKAQLLFHDLAVARIALAQGNASLATSLLSKGRNQALVLASEDSDNTDYLKQERMFELFQVRLWLGSQPKRRPPNTRIAAVLGDCAVRGPGADNHEISDFCNVLRARFLAERGDGAAAMAALALVKARAPRTHDVLTARWGLDLVAETRPIVLPKGGI